ncbi:MAG: GntR family transcriptional regulator [Pirellulaceae bacterium]
MTRMNLSATVYRRLLADLSGGRFPLGTHLKAYELADLYAVSPATVRKALARLVDDGWVASDEAGRPLVIAIPDESDDEVCDNYQNRTERTRDEVLNLALRGVFKPGDIIKAKPLAEQLGASMPTVREALDWLCNDGVCERLPRRGWQIPQLDLHDLKTLYEIRHRLEPMVVERAALRMSDEKIADMIAETERLAAAEQTVAPADHHWADFQFHKELIECSGDRVLREVLGPVLRRKMLIVTINRPVRRTSFLEHADILQAIARRDVGQAVARMEKHLGNALGTGFDEAAHEALRKRQA